MNKSWPWNSFPAAAAATVLCAFVAAAIVAVVTRGGFGHDSKRVAQQITCVNNLKQIGIVFKTWAVDNKDQLPFHVSTNVGGTMELCVLDQDGFDSNPALHFQVMSNELSWVKLLICPEDRSKKPAMDFGSLQSANVTYRLRSGPDVAWTNGNAVLIVCPLDGNILHCDGSVEERKGK